jgi:hypothetical protein
MSDEEKSVGVEVKPSFHTFDAKTSWADDDDEDTNYTINDIDTMIRTQVENLTKLKFDTNIKDESSNDDEEEPRTTKSRTNYKKQQYKSVRRNMRKQVNNSIFDYEISYRQKENNIYVDNTEDYVFYLEKNVRPCKFGIKCFRSKCDFMHVLPEAECEMTYLGKICPSINICKKIHQKRCKYDMDCNKKDCSFKHSTDMPTPEAQDEYIKTMEQYLKL